MSFDYLINKINASSIDTAPFPHIQINDFFSREHFEHITATKEIALSANTDPELFETLFNAGWKIISFPGCITDHKAYIEWHKSKDARKVLTNSACEGFGVTLRLVSPASTILKELSDFMASEPFKRAIAAKFGIQLADVYYDGGIQKYLDGYEISPHPDNRRKALTYMVNINPDISSATKEHHTQYLKFKDAYNYVQAYWEGRPNEERCWVPWSWCDRKKEQRENNSIVIFSPGNGTMHGVKANYDHLPNQRTQLYGNLWYHANPTLLMPDWEDLVIHPGRHRAEMAKNITLHSKISAVIPAPVRSFIKAKILGRPDAVDKSLVADRNKGGY